MKNFNIQAAFLKNFKVPYNVPEAWINQTINLGFGGHYFLKEAYHLLNAMGGKSLKNLKILDLGCGDAVVDCLLALMGAKVVVIDYADNFLTSARRYARLYGVEDKISFIKADIRKVPLKAKSFEVVWNGGVIEHFQNYGEIIKNMAALVKRQGVVIIDVPNYWTIHTFFYRPVLRLFRRYPFDCWGREKSFKRNELKNIMSQAGLYNTTLMTFNLQSAVLNDSIFIPMLNRRIIRKIAPSLINIFDYLEKKAWLKNFAMFLGARGMSP